MIWPDDKLTRFEVARLVGARSLQIALGAPVLAKTEKTGPIEIAKEEFYQVLIPMTIKRKLPNGEQVIVQIKKAIESWNKERTGEL